MPVPGYQDFMLPLLKLAADGREHKTAEAMENACQSDEHLRGRSRVAVAERNTNATDQSHIVGTCLLGEKPTSEEDRPGRFKITPEERLEAAHGELRDALADDVLQRVRGGSPKFFEHLVVRLLVAMGYGGGQVDRAEVTGKSGDEGIDGVIREDRLGLDMVYVQAKKWDNSVGPGAIDQFVGSLMRKKAVKGVFITSGTFTEGALRAAREAAVKVRLIDGDELAELMIDFNVGVAEDKKYVVKKLDSDFFETLT